ncbi:MAG TPA: cobalamin biosynthesis protein, partial [Rhizorhapis sp.]|nr:cobalamin biosynthesis protein [Rhizorhapis sp.]
MPDRAEQLLAALLIEAAIGYPNALHRRLPHPVVWAGTLISALERRWNGQHSSSDTPQSKRESRWIPAFAGMTREEAKNRLAGVATIAILVLAATFFGLLLDHLLTGWPGVLLLILVATTGIAQKSLHDHVRAVSKPLLAGNIGEARTALSKIVGRDTAPLDESAIAAAATESLAESFGDGIVTPAFWFLVADLPGLFVFKAVSTADSLIGHKDERYRHFGWAAARLDDVMNFVPARLSGLLLCLSSPSFLRRQRPRFFFGGAKGSGAPACAG